MRPVFKTFSTASNYYLYDRNKNSIIQIDRPDFVLLQKWKAGDRGEETCGVLHKFQRNGYLLDSVIEEIRQPCSGYFEEQINRKTEQVTLQLTQNCNLRCDYCAYTGGYLNRMYADKNMSFETAKKAIDYLFAHSCEKNRVALGFYGGEPLLRFDLLKRCVAYVKECYPEKDVLYTVTTNGTLLTDTIVEYLFSNDINVMISLDGPQELHDRHRKYPDGSGSFDVVMKNLKRIKEKYPDYYKKISINTVLSPNNDFSCVKDFYDTDAVMDFYNPRYSLINENNLKKSIEYEEEFSITSRTESLKALLWIAGRLEESAVSSLFRSGRGVYKRIHEHLGIIDGLPRSCHPGGPCLAGIKRLFVDVEGNLFPCERVSEESEAMKIGYLDTGIDLEKARRLINVGEISKDACASCWGFIHCTQCAAFADDTHALSPQRRLSNCPRVLNSILEQFKDYCFLMEHGVDFDEQEGEDIVREDAALPV